jgi:hypothetical protein
VNPASVQRNDIQSDRQPRNGYIVAVAISACCLSAARSGWCWQAGQGVRSCATWHSVSSSRV